MKSAVAEFFNLIKKDKMSKLKAKDPHTKSKKYTDDEKIKRKFDYSGSEEYNSDEDSMPELEDGDRNSVEDLH